MFLKCDVARERTAFDVDSAKIFESTNKEENGKGDKCCGKLRVAP